MQFNPNDPYLSYNFNPDSFPDSNPSSNLNSPEKPQRNKDNNLLNFIFGYDDQGYNFGNLSPRLEESNDNKISPLQTHTTTAPIDINLTAKSQRVSEQYLGTSSDSTKKS